jgi:hypothetical protein
VWWERGSGLMIPDSFDADALYDVYPDDIAVLNVVATQRHREQRAAEDARRKTIVARVNSTLQVRESEVRNGHEVKIR